jgi:hypothetical protein
VKALRKLIGKIDLEASYVIAAAVAGCALALLPGREVPYFFAPTTGNVIALGIIAVGLNALTFCLRLNARRTVWTAK